MNRENSSGCSPHTPPAAGQAADLRLSIGYSATGCSLIEIRPDCSVRVIADCEPGVSEAEVRAIIRAVNGRAALVDILKSIVSDAGVGQINPEARTNDIVVVRVTVGEILEARDLIFSKDSPPAVSAATCALRGSLASSAGPRQGA